MQSGAVVACLVALGAAFVVTPAIAAPKLADMVLSDQKDGPAQASFKPNTAKVYLRAKLADVPAGAKLKSEWIAVKTEVAPANYKIDSVELVAGKGATNANFAMGKPTTGWPEGSYRVDVFIDGKPAGNVPFKVAK